MLRIFNIAVGCGLLAVSGCAGQSPTVVATDVQGDITVAQALLTTLEQGKTPTKIEADASTFLAGLQVVDAAYIGSSSGTVATQALVTLDASIGQAEADLPSNAAVQKYGALAHTAIAAAEATPNATLTQQAEQAAGVLLIDVLAGTQQTQALAQG